MVTIGIPFYNNEKFLELAINSVIAQTYNNWKLILMDDGSTDNSLKIAKKYEKQDRRIKVFSDGENKNLPFRLNQIARLCNTKYLARMDADDIMHPQKILKQVEVLEQDSTIDVLGTNAYVIDENNFVHGCRIKREEKELINVTSFIHPSIMAKTTWFVNNPYDESALRMEDIELWFRTNKVANFKIITKPLFFYREIAGDYYKKYFALFKSKKYILLKYNNCSYWKLYFYSLFVKSVIYRFFSIINFERYLINRRNEVVFKSKIPVEELIYFNNINSFV